MPICTYTLITVYTNLHFIQNEISAYKIIKYAYGLSIKF